MTVYIVFYEHEETGGPIIFNVYKWEAMARTIANRIDGWVETYEVNERVK